MQNEILQLRTKFWQKIKFFKFEDDVPLEMLKEKNMKKMLFFASLKSLKKVVGSGSGSIRRGTDPGIPNAALNSTYTVPTVL